VHVQITAGDEGTGLRDCFERLYKALGVVQEQLESSVGASFAFDPHLGYLASSPSKLGTALSVSVTAALPALASASGGAELRSVARRVGLEVAGLGEGGQVRLVNGVRAGPSEVELLLAVMTGVHTLVQLEKAAAARDRARIEVILGSLPQHWTPSSVPSMNDPRWPKTRPGYLPEMAPGG
jgi:protein-arginine kinase